MLVSGLSLATASENDLLSLQLMVDWLGGLLGDPGEQKNVASIARVIFAGELNKC